jgi:hypothetical protein
MVIFLLLFAIFMLIAMLSPNAFKFLVFVPILGLASGGFVWVLLALAIPQCRSVEAFAACVIGGFILSSVLFDSLV